MERMTFSQARAKLKKYYRVLELAKEYHLQSSDIIVVVDNPKRTASPAELEVVRRLDLLASVRDVEEALQRLQPDYRKFLELRFGQEFSLRQVGREMHMGLGTAYRFEAEALGAFISALGKLPESA